MTNSTERSSIAWIDWLRIIACFLVVLAHVCDAYVAQFEENYADFSAGILYGSLLRACVPLFVMASGVLLLPVKESMTVFYRRRLSRVVIPLVVWSIAMPIIFYLYYGVAGITTPNPNIIAEDYTLQHTWQKCWQWILNYNYTTIPFWYLYMLVGLYLVMPIVSVWLQQAERKEIKMVLWIWGFTLLIPYIELGAPSLGYEGNYGDMGILGSALWNPFGTFYYFSGFIGYIILAYYLKKYPLSWSNQKLLAICTPLYFVGFAITYISTTIIHKAYPGSYAAIEIIWYYFNINVFAMTIAAYLLIQRFCTKGSHLISQIASFTFGVYLCHWIIVHLWYDLCYSILPFTAAINILIITFISFASSVLITWFLSKLPLRRYIVG